jgi:hypothetical protein
MSIYKQLFMQHMDSVGIRYTDVNENSVKISYTGDNLKTIGIFVMFDKEGNPSAELKCWEVANFKNKEAKGLVVCNELNSKYRWVKFFVDKSADIIVEADAILDNATCGEECMSMVRRMVRIIDESYPSIGRALWA